MSGSSLSSVVSDLVRASRSSVPGTVTDADLDRHIGEIILREAKQKAERYKKDGIRAYLPTADPNLPRANKRFLSSIIKSTDDHNKAVSHSQAVAAAESKEVRDEQERRERRARADEAAQDRLRMLMSGGRRRHIEDRWRPGRERERHRSKSERARDDSIQQNLPREISRSRSRDWERHWDDDPKADRNRIESSHRRHRNNGHHRHHRRRSSSRSRSPARDQGRSKQHRRSRSRTRARADNETHRSHRRHQHHSSSPSHSPHQATRAPNRSRSPTLSTTSNNDSRRTHRLSLSHSRSRSPCRSTRKHTSPINTTLKSPSPILDVALSPSPPLASLSRTPSPRPMASKMDKYFSPTYDPRLDVAPLVSSSSGLTVDVPSTGLVDNAQFEGWDAMLELIRIRREDRAEKKRLERLGLLPERDKDGRGKKGKGMVSAGVEDGKGIMEIAYQKKGAVREWDMGKEGF